MSLRSTWLNFMRHSLGTGVAVGARAAGALVLNKLVAVYGGPGSLTALAQFQNLMALFGALPTDGIQVGATARLAPLRPGSGRYRAWLGAALALTAAAVGAAGALLLATGGAAWPAGRVLLFGGAMLLVSWQALLTTALLAAGRRGAYVAQAVALSGLGTAAVGAALAAGWPLHRVLLAYVGGQALALPLALGAATRAGLLRGLPGRLPGSPAARAGLLRFVLMAAGGLLFGRAVDYAVRDWLLAHYGAATDYWQAVAKLSDNYTLVVAALLSTVFYPRLAALAGQPTEARRYLLAVLGLLALALAGGLGLVWLLRDWLLPLLFAPRLLAARALLGPQLLGDWLKFLSWVLLYPLLLRGRTGAYLAVQAASAAVYGALLAGLLPRYGLAGAVLAHAGRYALVLAGCGVGRWIPGFWFEKNVIPSLSRNLTRVVERLPNDYPGGASEIPRQARNDVLFKPEARNKTIPLVTVVALCHNHAPFLREALDSIVAQTYARLEVWLVDNGSTDGSVNILREYAAAQPGWRTLFFETNTGNCHAFNAAFRQSQGEFVLDFATDDVLLPTRLAQQVALFAELPADYGMVYSNCELLDEAGRPQGTFQKLNSFPGHSALEPRPASGWVFADVLGRFFISTPTMLMRRATLLALGGYDEALSYEDFDFWVRAGRDWRFQYQDAVTTRKRLHPHSLSAQTTRRHDPHLASTLVVCRKALALCRTRAELRVLAGRVRYELAHALRRRQWREARIAARLLVEVVGRVVGLRGQA